MIMSKVSKSAACQAIDDLLADIEDYKVTLPFTTEELEFRISFLLAVLYPTIKVKNIILDAEGVKITGVLEISLVPEGQGTGHLYVRDEEN